MLTLEDLVDCETETKAVPPRRKRKMTRWPITRKELESMLKWIKGDSHMSATKQFNLCALCILLYVTGCRIGEVLAMNREQIAQLVSGEDVRIVIPKTHTSRVLFLPAAYQDLVKTSLPALVNGSALHATGLVNSDMRKLSYRLAEKWLHPYLVRLRDQVGAVGDNCAVFNSHSFRVGYINRMLNHFSLPEVASLVGHSNYSTTLTYARNTNNTDYFRQKLDEAKRQID